MSKTLRGVLKRQVPPIPDTTPPTTPTSLSASIVGNQVSLTWTPGVDNVAVTATKIWRSTTSGVFTTPLTTTGALSAYTDTTAVPSTLYYYTVSQIDGASPPNESAKATQASVTTPSLSDVTAPNVPGQPSVAVVDNTQNPPTFTTTVAPVADIDPGDGSPVSGMGSGSYVLLIDGVQQPGSVPQPGSVGSFVGSVIGTNSGGSIVTGSDSGTVIQATSTTGDTACQMWSTQDEVYAQSAQVSGAGSMLYKVTAFAAAWTWSKGGLALRADLSAGAAFISVVVFTGYIKVEFRASTGGQAAGGTILTNPGLPLWFRLVWDASWNVTVSYSTVASPSSESDWTSMGTIAMSFGATAYAQRFVDPNTAPNGAGSVGGTASLTYSNFAVSASSVVSFSGVGAAGTTKNVAAKAIDRAGNISAASPTRAVTFSSQSAPASQYYPGLAGYTIGGSPRNYGTDAWIALSAKRRTVTMATWPSWQGAGQSSKDVPTIIAAIKALNPNTQVILYTDWMRLLPNSVYASLKATLDSHNGWLRASYPSGAVVSWDGGTYPDPTHTYSANITDATAQADIANFHVDYLNNGDAGGYNTVHPNSVNSIADGWFFDDIHWNMNYLSGALDVNKDGSADARNSTLDQTWRNGQTAAINAFKAKKPAAKVWINLAIADISNYSGFRTDFSGRLLEGMIGETWSPDTWGQFTDLLSWYDLHGTLLAAGASGIFAHQLVGVNGTDPYDATPYRASCFGLCASLLGNSSGWTADYFPSPSVDYSVNADNRWFDEFAVNTSGVALTQAQESANNGRGYLGNPLGVRQMRAMSFTSSVGGATAGTLAAAYLQNGARNFTFGNGETRSVTVTGTSCTWTPALSAGTVTTATTPLGVYIRAFANGWAIVFPKNGGTQLLLPADVGGTSVAKFISGTQDSARNSSANFTSNYSGPARSGLILLKRSAFGG